MAYLIIITSPNITERVITTKMNILIDQLQLITTIS